MYRLSIHLLSIAALAFALQPAMAAVITEDFTSDPVNNGFSLSDDIDTTGSETGVTFDFTAGEMTVNYNTQVGGGEEPSAAMARRFVGSDDWTMSTVFNVDGTDFAPTGAGLVAASTNPRLGRDYFLVDGYTAMIRDTGFTGTKDLIIGRGNLDVGANVFAEFSDIAASDFDTLDFSGTYQPNGDLLLEAELFDGTGTTSLGSISHTVLSANVVTGSHFGLFTAKSFSGNTGTVVYDSVTITATAIPEPSTLLLMGLAMSSLLIVSRARR